MTQRQTEVTSRMVCTRAQEKPRSSSIEIRAELRNEAVAGDRPSARESTVTPVDTDRQRGSRLREQRRFQPIACSHSWPTQPRR